MNEKLTYKDQGKTKWYFISTIDVVCPKCKKKATLKTPNKNQVEPKLKCHNCYFTKSGFEYSAHSNIQKIVCQKCNTVADLETKELSQTVKKTNCKCEECGFINQVEVEFDLMKSGGMYNSQIKDQYYGLDFWYKINFKNNCLWAYNLEHLNDIQKYVEAEVRKRHNGEYQSVLEKLPKWISSKKNRPEIVKALEKLRKKTA